jgi:hypothetical protein
MNSIKVAGMLCALAVVVMVAAAPQAFAVEPSTGFYNVALDSNCNQFYFWTQAAGTSSPTAWQYVSGYQYGCGGEFGTFNDIGFQVSIKAGQSPNDTNGTDRTAIDVTTSDLYWPVFIGNYTDMYANVFDIAPTTSKKYKKNACAVYYVDGDTFLYEYDYQYCTVTYGGEVPAKLQQDDPSRASLPAMGSTKPTAESDKVKDGIRVQ